MTRVQYQKDNQHSGLGLFIVKSLVQKHNGSIVVDNSDDMVTFTVFSPKILLLCQQERFLTCINRDSVKILTDMMPTCYKGRYLPSPMQLALSLPNHPSPGVVFI